MQTTNKLMTLIKKVIQLKDDQYIENLTFKVMDQIEAENEPGWKAAQEKKYMEWRNLNYFHQLQGTMWLSG